ncbi:MAG: metallophosphoesterase [Gammaproteobacteria bacterium]|nr:metallophosphoesterase [Gammaproteobacteria bacterium]
MKHRDSKAVMWRDLRFMLMAMLASALLAGCGSSSSTAPPTSEGSANTTSCDASESTSQTDDDCGEVFVGLTDAEGDFATYTVDVRSLTLVRSDGVVVETLPTQTRVDFAEYTELTEFLTAASVPPGTYVAGSIHLDYSDAEVYVEKGDDFVPATVVDANGQAIADAEFEILLDNRRQLVVRRGIPSLLTIDFDLAASHEVDLSTSPATATAEPYLIAEVDPVDAKTMRLRGPLISVSLDESAYAVRIRPFHDRDTSFGRARVNTDANTEFEVDGVTYEGEAGLEAMTRLATGSPTLAFGELSVIDRSFLATEVYAGSSVPGYDFDVIRGNVIERTGNRLKVRGAIIVPRQGRARFHRTATVLVDEGTKVLRRGHDSANLGINAISVGQRINAFGSVTADPDDGIVLDATEGRVRMLMTRLNGLVNSVFPGQIDIALQSIDRRPIRIFDFTGTGLSEAVDADPDNYEIATGALDNASLSEGAAVKVFGFVNSFGEAPPDFEARSFADYSDSRAMLAIGWGPNGTTAPFADLGPDGMLLDLSNPEIGGRHYIRQGDVFIDLLGLSAAPVIAPNPERPGVYAIKQGNRIWIHSDFALFTSDLAARLDGNTRVRGMYAKGGYEADASLFLSTRIGVIVD